MTLVLGLQERERQKRAGLALCCPTEHGVTVRSQAHLGFWEIGFLEKVSLEVITFLLCLWTHSNGHLLPDHMDKGILTLRVNFYTEEKELLFPLLLAITLLLLSNLNRIKPRCRIQK